MLRRRTFQLLRNLLGSSADSHAGSTTSLGTSQPAANFSSRTRRISTLNFEAMESRTMMSGVSTIPGIPALSSQPGATYTFYLDFGGFNFSGDWCNVATRTPGVVPAYDTDGNPSQFSATETANIREIWTRVAEKYAPFNINVTTVDPAVTTGGADTDLARQNYYDAQPYMIHTIIGGTSAWLHAVAGGISRLNVAQFAEPNTNGYHTDWVFSANNPVTPEWIASAITHENGHTLNLWHASDYNGTTLVAEYAMGTTTLAPIMGFTAPGKRGLWAVGTADGWYGLTTQNDLQVIASDAGMGGFRADGVGHTRQTATPLPVNNGVIDFSAAAGLIVPLSTSNPTPLGASNYTEDWWSFTTPGGAMNLTVNSGRQALVPGTADPGATLNASLEIYDAAGQLVSTVATSSLSETYSGNLAAGTYYARIRPAADAYDPAYHTRSFFDMGDYFLTGTLPTAPAATHLSFEQQPMNAIAGQTLAPAVTVRILDANNNLITTDNSAVTLSLASGAIGATLNGTLTVSAVNGIATFNNLSLTKSGTYTLQASDGTATGAISQSFTISAAAAAQLAFGALPASSVAGAAISPAVTVRVLDVYNNLVTTDSSDVTLSLNTAPSGATLNGTTTATTINGVATFTNLSLIKAGSYTLTAVDLSLTPATSSTLTINPAAAAQLNFVQQPSSATLGAALAPAVTVQVLDAYGNRVNSDASAVTLAIATGPSGASIGGSVTVNAVNGLATFSSLALDRAGDYTLRATDGALTSATSSSFTIAPIQFGTDASGTAISWNSLGAAFLPFASVKVDSSGHLVVNFQSNVTGNTGSPWLDASSATAFGSNTWGTPWVQLSWIDPTLNNTTWWSFYGIDGAASDRNNVAGFFSTLGTGIVGAVSYRNATNTGNNTQDYVLGPVSAGAAHTLKIGKRLDGTIDYIYDGVLAYSSAWLNSTITGINDGKTLTFPSGASGAGLEPSHIANWTELSLSMYRGIAGQSYTFTNLSMGDDYLATPNHAPSFVSGGDQTVYANSGTQTVTGWATSISAGPAEENSQTLNFVTSNDNASLFEVQPTIAPDGTLTYTPAVNAFGSALVTVQLHDSGGTLWNGVDTSAAQTFRITIQAQPPVAVDDAYGVVKNTTLTVTTLNGVMVNDQAAPGESLTASLIAGQGPTHGKLTFNADGSFKFTPTLNYLGTDSFQYRITDTHGFSAIATANLTIGSVPKITKQPVGKSVVAGTTVSLLATASGTPAPTAQWQCSTDGGVTFNNIDGATASTYSFTAQVSQNNFLYRAVFTNAIGSVTSAAAKLVVKYAPVVVTGPVSQSVVAGQIATFTAAGTGNPAPTVQWYVSKNCGSTWTGITGATSLTYSFTASTTQNGWCYRARFYNSVGTVYTNLATLTVTPAAPVV